MDGSIHFEQGRYRSDLAWVRKCLALNRAGPDMCIRLEAAIPGAPAPAAVDVFLSRQDVWIVGFRTNTVAVKFKDTNPAITGVNITRTLPFSPNYSILGAWNEGLTIPGPGRSTTPSRRSGR